MMPFENIRVADFTTMLAGAGICREIADLGADVIKIEPADGDPWRMLAGGFMGVNRGKRGIVIDLRKPEACPIAHKLISTCQILVENSRPGIMKKLGMDYDTIKKIRPDIIYVSSPAFGSKGPDAERPGYDPLFQAWSGHMEGQGGLGQTPVFHKIQLSDEMGPLLGAFGASLALFNKLRTGQGQFLETSLLRSAITLQSGNFIKYKGMKRKNLGKPDIKGLSATNRMYQGIDGEWLYVFCAKEEHWEKMCDVLGLKKLVTDPRFSTPAARKRHDKELTAILTETFLATPASIWSFLMMIKGVPAAYAQNLESLLKDQFCKDTGVYEFQQHPQWGKVQLQGIVPEFSETPGKVQRPAPMLGQHTEEVLSEIGYTKEQIEDFKAKGLVVQVKMP
ncbi:MAG: CoA transferase [Dehalococcoidia bacterium]|jgi:crotonobetainyl-CoA:carnitine CoA-transferase CaiB-like acyl-CoA transferase